MQLVALLFALVGCGHALRAGAGPLVDSRGNPGLVASLEAGTHLLSAQQVTMPIGVRAEVSATRDGVQGILGVAWAIAAPPGGRQLLGENRITRRGWGGRASFGAGALGDDRGLAFGARTGAALTRGSIDPDGRTGGGCGGSGEKTRYCYAWHRWRYAETGAELALTTRFAAPDDDPDARAALDGWRIAAEIIHARGVLEDVEVH